MSTTHRCHDCQHLGTSNERAYCKKKHAIAYEFPADSLATDYGFKATGKSCARDFTPRDSSFYQRPTDFTKLAKKRAPNAPVSAR